MTPAAALRLLPAPLPAVILAGLLAACAGRTPLPSEPAEAPLPPGLRALPARFVHDATGLVLVRVPAGRYVRGSPPDEPHRDTDERAHEVELAHDFWLGETEVTVAQWERVMGADFDAPSVDPALPVTDVTWYEAEEFIQRLNELGPPGRRLPCEDEWEYACRAGTTTPFAFGDDIRPELVQYNAYYPYRPGPRGERASGPKPVRSLPPNAWGFFEMHGNVVEWCSDVYTAEPGPTPAPESEGASRVLRGGSYVAAADQVRSAWREGYPPKSDGREYGLRVAWSPPGAR